MSTAQHTPAPWRGRGADGKYSSKNKWRAEHQDAPLSSSAPIMAGNRTVALVVSTDWDDDQLDANARLIAEAPALLAELEKAHTIIRNALALMTPAEQLLWGESNFIDDVEGEGVTRAHEREAVIRRAKGGGGNA